MTFVLAAPVAMWLVLRGGANDMLTSPPATPAPTPTATATPAPTPSRTPPAPDGRISLARLKNAELDIPRWPADNVPGPSGRLKFSNGTVVVPADSAFPFARDVIILGVTYGDVDGDGAQETLAEIGCLLSEAGSTQLVAFDRDAAGDIVTMGTVVATAGEIRAVAGDSVRVQDDGSVSVKVGDYQRCCGDETPQQWQVRRYGWDGHQFSQVGGPAAFPG